MARPLRLLPLLLLLVAALAFSGAASAQPPRDPIDLSQVSEALLRDAGQYASTMGVSLEEAVYRLLLQQDIGELNAKLEESEPGTFAGMWIEHQPHYRVIAAFTHDGEATIGPYEGGPLASIVEVPTVEATQKELLKARAEAAALADSLGIETNSAVDVTHNTAVLYVLDPAALDAALGHARLSLPDHVQVVQVDALATPVTDIYGGLALSQCTSGFSVIDASSYRGITTAGHCGNSLSYSGVGLTFVSGTPDDDVDGTGPDIQWHRADSFTVRNLAWDGSTNRYIYYLEYNANQTVGEWVCKYGKITGYPCGTIYQKYYGGFNNLVALTVAHGDSGGPWMIGNTAYGTTIAFVQLGGTIYSIYGAVDHISSILGVTVLTY